MLKDNCLEKKIWRGQKRGVSMDGFSEKSLLALGDYYVYGLVDPRCNRLFYIGKGSGNRVFEHERESLNNPDSEKLKLKTISEIKLSGLEVIKIIINSGLTENEAFAAQTKAVRKPRLEDPNHPKPTLPCTGGNDCPGILRNI